MISNYILFKFYETFYLNLLRTRDHLCENKSPLSIAYPKKIWTKSKESGAVYNVSASNLVLDLNAKTEIVYFAVNATLWKQLQLQATAAVFKRSSKGPFSSYFQANLPFLCFRCPWSIITRKLNKKLCSGLSLWNKM